MIFRYSSVMSNKLILIRTHLQIDMPIRQLCKILELIYCMLKFTRNLSGTRKNFVISRTNVLNVQVCITPETVQRMLHTLLGV